MLATLEFVCHYFNKFDDSFLSCSFLCVVCSDVVIFQPKRLVTKLEPDQLRYPDVNSFDLDKAKDWVYENM